MTERESQRGARAFYNLTEFVIGLTFVGIAIGGLLNHDYQATIVASLAAIGDVTAFEARRPAYENKQKESETLPQELAEITKPI